MSRKPEPTTDRVRRHLVMGLAASPLVGGAVLKGVLAAPAPRPSEEAAQEEGPGPHREEAEALMKVLSRRYGEYLREEQLPEVRRSLERGLAAAAGMSAAGLEDHEEPDFVFSPYRKEEE